MRSALALGLLITLCASANATRLFGETFLSRMRAREAIRPVQPMTRGAQFAVPGWPDQQTQYWLDNATASAGLG